MAGLSEPFPSVVEGSGGRADGRDRDRVSPPQSGLLRHGLALWAGSLHIPVSPDGSCERPSVDIPDKTAIVTMVGRVWCHRALASCRDLSYVFEYISIGLGV